MQHWDRNTTGRLKRTSAPQEQGCEVSLHSNQMEPPPEEQKSQQGIPRNLNAYMSMRDHIHPPRVSTPTKSECTLMHYTSYRRCSRQALFGAPVPNLPWYEK